jgi:hypothetical protein
MSFNKKIINKEILFEVLSGDGSLEELFYAESLIFKDELVCYTYDLFKNGYSKEEILIKILK